MSSVVRKIVGPLFENREFRWLLWGNTAMFFGFFATILLRSLLAWHITEDEMALAWVNLLAALCMFVASLFAGTLIDRFEKKRMLVLAQCVVVFAETLILVLLLVDKITLPFLLLASAATSVAFPFIMPARTAMLVDAVGKLKLAKGTALMNAGVNLARMVSPAMIGVLSESVGFAFCYVLLLSLHIVSLIFTLRLRAYHPEAVARDSFLKETLGGFTYIFARRSLAWCMLFGIVPMLVTVPLQNLMVVYVEALWQRGGTGLGIMMAVMGVGGVVGSLFMVLLEEGQYVKPMVYSTLAMGLCLVLFAYSQNFWLAALMVLGIYSASVLSYTLVSIAIQLMSEDYIRGRITTITMMSISLAPMGTIPLAYATKQIGAAWSLTGAAVLLVITVLLLWGLSPAFRDIDRQSRHHPQ